MTGLDDYWNPDAGTYTWSNGSPIPVFCTDCHETSDQADGRACPNCGSMEIVID